MPWDYGQSWEWCCPQQEEGCFPPHMDARHVELIYRLVSEGLFRNILEIGSWNGYSTSAFVQAQIEGADFKLTVCDIEIRPRLMEVLKKSPADVNIRNIQAKEVINEKYDLILVDGDHRLFVVAEEIEALLRCRTPNILAHDTSACVPWFDGSRHLANVFKYHGNYQWLEDNKKRPNEWTERGLFFASKHRSTFGAAKKIWEEYFGA